jgi:hypothetical protein
LPNPFFLTFITYRINRLKKPKKKNLIGRREQVDFPDLGLFQIAAKIDTGAYTSALHCHDIREKNGVLYFKVLDPGHPDHGHIDHQAAIYSQKDIKNSFGENERRYLIKTRLKMGKRTMWLTLSLTNRGTMRYPVLIGRRFLKNRYVVDVSQLDIAAANLKTDY